MLAGLSSLKELYCWGNANLTRVTGNINSLRVLKNTLESVIIENCPNVEGNFMDLADFPHLEELCLEYTAVTGDIRDIGEHDFSSLECLILPEGVYGCRGYQFQRISDAPDLMRTLYQLNAKRPVLSLLNDWSGILSENSPDWYEDEDDPPFNIISVKVGSRLGYRWQTIDYEIYYVDPCEMNWLDPEPDRESSDYAKYIEELQEINSQVKMYKGFHQPPTAEEFRRLIEVLQEEGRWW